MRKKKSIIAIVGPTASGKSDLAVRLAKEYNGEIISADSRQVYKWLAIGSGRVDGRWQKLESPAKGEARHGRQKSKVKTAIQNSKFFTYKTIPHHCIDYVSPKKHFTVVDFQQCAQKAITDIHARGKIPFLVGGTGFYIDAVLGNTRFPAVPPNYALRKKLGRLSSEKLFAILKKYDPHRATTIDLYNKRRLIRALEIIMTTKKPIKTTSVAYDKKLRPQKIIVVRIGIQRDKKTLQNAITKRIHAMLKRGLVAETKKLRSQGLSWERIAEFGFEYRLPALFLQKKISRRKLEEQLIKENWRYAKRQTTWWKRNKNIHWVSTSREARRIISAF